MVLLYCLLTQKPGLKDSLQLGHAVLTAKHRNMVRSMWSHLKPPHGGGRYVVPSYPVCQSVLSHGQAKHPKGQGPTVIPWGCSACHWDVEGSITERKQMVGISHPVFYAIIHFTVPLWFGIWIVSGFNSHKSHCYKHC